jgi:hypothetical protein
MSAVQSTSIAVNRAPASPARLRTYLMATIAVTVGTLAIAILMSISVLLAAPASSFSAAPAPEPMPQASVQAGLDR